MSVKTCGSKQGRPRLCVVMTKASTDPVPEFLVPFPKHIHISLQSWKVGRINSLLLMIKPKNWGGKIIFQRHVTISCVPTQSLSRVWLFVTPVDLWPSRLLCPWNSSGKNTGVGCHSLLQGIFSTQGMNLGLLHFLHRSWILYGWATREAPTLGRKPQPIITSPILQMRKWGHRYDY